MMKKWLTVLLCVLLVALSAPAAFAVDLPKREGSSFGAYERVFILGVDGAGTYFSKADTPNFDRFFADGAIKYDARAEVYTDSGPNWGSILSGVSFLRTGYTNGNVSPEGEDWANGFHMRTFPSVFRAARCAFPDAPMASYVNYPSINYTIIENDIGVEKVTIENDEELTQAICDYFDSGAKPKLFYSHFCSVDDVGHVFGSDSEEYIRQIELTDGYLGSVFDALERNGLLEDALVLFVTDHGHKPDGGHGRFSMRESLATVAAKGKTVVPGGTFDCGTRNRDIAAIALFALGVPKPVYMTARVPGNLFQNTFGEPRPILRDLPDAIVSAVMWIYTLSTAEK